MINFRFFSLALGVAWAHIASGILIFLNFNAIKVTPLAFLKVIPIPQPFNGTILILASLLVFAAYVTNTNKNVKPWITLTLLLPQQFLLLLSLISILLAVATGTYPDGYSPQGGGIFILADQLWMLTICIWHTVEYYSAQNNN